MNSSAVHEAEAEFHEDLRKFYLEEDGLELIVGSASDAGIQYIENSKDHRSQEDALVRIF